MRRTKKFTKKPVSEISKMAVLYNEVEEHWHGRASFDYEPSYLMNRLDVALRERESQKAHVCGFVAASMPPSGVLHLDCNILRLIPDTVLNALIPFYDYKSAILLNLSKMRWQQGAHDMATEARLDRRVYEQASIKLKRERDRRKLVYNL